MVVGRTISHYKITEKLGQGGMGVVYKAEDTKLGRIVALKFLPSQYSADEEQKSRFMVEAKSASSIDHPNIGAIYEIDETPEGDLFIVMAYYEGQTLKQKIDAGRCEVKESIALIGQIASGLAKAHERGIIHRDLKPANIILTSDGTPKIIDFGLAKLTGGTKLTRTGTSLGTVAYMSPEQTRGEEVGPNTDIWSLGVIIHEMLAGQLPFQGNYEPAMMYSIVNEQPPSITTIRDDIPTELVLILEKALQKDPAKRFQSMGEITAALSGLTGSMGAGVAATSSAQLASRLFQSVVQRHRRGIYIGAAAAVILIAGLWYGLTRSAGPSMQLSRSIAVLPFANLGDQEQEYYSDGLTGDLTQELAKLPQTLVISKKSTSTYRGSALDPKSIAASLGVRYLLRGDLQLLPARVKMHASIYDAERGKEIWQDSYEISRGEILQAKADIMKQTAKQLGAEISFPLTSAGTTSDVYEPYLQGMYYRDKFNKDQNILAIEYFTEAHRKDTTFLPAAINLANTKIEQYRAGWDRSEKLLTDAEELAGGILRRDSANAQAKALLGGIKSLRGDVKGGLDLLLTSIEKDRNDPFALTFAATLYLMNLGEPAKGVRLLKQLQEIDPNDWLVTSNLGIAYAQMANFTEAIKAFRRSAELNPNSYFPYRNLAYAFEHIGKLDSAIANYRIAVEKEPSDPGTYDAMAAVELVQGRYTEVESLLSSAMALIPGDHQIMYDLGVAYILGGKAKDGLKLLREGLQLVQQRIKKNPGAADHHAFEGLYNARLGEAGAAVKSVSEALQRDSSNEEILMKAARVFSITGKKPQMLEMFRRAKAANPEYNASYLATALDFERYRTDADLLLIARGE